MSPANPDVPPGTGSSAQKGNQTGMSPGQTRTLHSAHGAAHRRKTYRRESRKPGGPNSAQEAAHRSSGCAVEGAGSGKPCLRGRGSGPSLIESSCSVTEKTRTAQNGPADLCPKKHRRPAGVCRGTHHHHPRGKWGNSLFCPKSMNCQVVFLFVCFFENKRNAGEIFLNPVIVN